MDSESGCSYTNESDPAHWFYAIVCPGSYSFKKKGAIIQQGFKTLANSTLSQTLIFLCYCNLVTSQRATGYYSYMTFMLKICMIDCISVLCRQIFITWLLGDTTCGRLDKGVEMRLLLLRQPLQPEATVTEATQPAYILTKLV